MDINPHLFLHPQETNGLIVYLQEAVWATCFGWKDFFSKANFEIYLIRREPTFTIPLIQAYGAQAFRPAFKQRAFSSHPFLLPLTASAHMAAE